MRLSFIWTLVALGWASAAAPDLKPSTSWRKPNITTSRDERISIASAALEKALSNLQPNGMFSDSAYGTPGMLYAHMAEFDRLTNQTKYKDTLKQYFSLVESANSGFLNEFMNYGLIYGYAAARAYAAYQDSDFLGFAVTSWTSGRLYTINDSQAASGIMYGKEIQISSSCQNATMAGGTFWCTDSNQPELDCLGTGSFLAVSALLAEATYNQTYINASIESANFIQNHLLNPSNIVLDSISSQSNESCAVDSSIYPYNSGIFIEGLAILADIAQGSSAEALLPSTIIATVSESGVWQGTDGVIAINGTGGYFIVRALTEVYERNTISSDLREYVKEYLGVQYNAVVDLAQSANGSNVYGMPWTGPQSVPTFNSDAQTTALTALISSLLFTDDQPLSNPSTNTTTTSGSGSASASSTKKYLAGVIAGGVIGGIALLSTLIVVALFLYKRHRKKNHGAPLFGDDSPPPTLSPFTVSQNMSSSWILGQQKQRSQGEYIRHPGVTNRGEPSLSGVATNGEVGRRVDVQSLQAESAASLDRGATSGSPNALLGEGRNERPISLGQLDAEEPPPEYQEENAM